MTRYLIHFPQNYRTFTYEKLCEEIDTCKAFLAAHPEYEGYKVYRQYENHRINCEIEILRRLRNRLMIRAAEAVLFFGIVGALAVEFWRYFA